MASVLVNLLYGSMDYQSGRRKEIRDDARIQENPPLPEDYGEGFRGRQVEWGGMIAEIYSRACPIASAPVPAFRDTSLTAESG